jgi:hypothetical protein
MRLPATRRATRLRPIARHECNPPALPPPIAEWSLQESPAQKHAFREPVQADRPALPFARKYFTFVLSEFMVRSPVPSHMRGASRSSRTLRRDAVGVSMLQRGLSMPTNSVDAHGQVAWSWHPDADVKLVADAQRAALTTVAKKPGAPGRTRSSRSNYRAGNAGRRIQTVVATPVCFLFI